MFIKRLAPNIYDVFTGTQWNEWTRVRRFRDGIGVIAGRPLNRSTLNQVKERLVRK